MRTKLDNCLLCEHIRGHIVGARASLAKDQKGRLIDLAISQKLPDSEALGMPDGHKFPLCRGCADYVQQWIGIRIQAHMQRNGNPAANRIMIANAAMERQAKTNYDKLMAELRTVR